jgi:hypothetical protein
MHITKRYYLDGLFLGREAVVLYETEPHTHKDGEPIRCLKFELLDRAENILLDRELPIDELVRDLNAILHVVTSIAAQKEPIV